VGTVLDFSLKKETSSKLTNAAEPNEVLDTCTGTGTTVKGTLEKNPDTTGTATVKNTSVVWEKCTFTTTTVTPGALKVERIAGTSNGTVREDSETEFKVTINTVFFGTCTFGVKGGAHLGVITEGIGTASEFKTENAAVEKLEGSNIACPAKWLWTATYVLTIPEKTTLSVSSS
jgi:hypothetical protein